MSRIARRLAQSPRLFALSVLAFAVPLGQLPGQARRAVSEEEPLFDPVALDADRSYFAQLPWENVDMSNGNLLLTFPQIVLKGNFGMDLRLEWAYNRGAMKWHFGLAGVPTYLSHPDGRLPNEPLEIDATPTAHRYDGGSHRLWPTADSNVFLSPEFWRYTMSTHTLELGNGWIATYELNTGDGVAMLVELRDAFVNRINPTWETRPPGVYGPVRLVSVTQTVGADTRTVTIARADAWRVASATFVAGNADGSNRTWTFDYVQQSGMYTPSAFQPPVGPPWQLNYTGAPWAPTVLQVTTPGGGTVSYTFEHQFFPPDEDQGYVVRQRTTGGRGIPPGTWTFAYNDRADGLMHAYVDLPDGRRLRYSHRNW
jgi:hypothetical protein